MKTTIIGNSIIALYTDGKLYYSIDNEERCAYVHGAKDSLRKVVIPDTVVIDGSTYKVRGIAENAFTEHKMQAIIIGDEVRSIDGRAFCGCLNLESVSIGVNLQMIGNNAFTCCSHLTTINFPPTLKRIGHFAFSYCDRLNDIHSDINDPSLCTVERTSFDEQIYQRVHLHIPNNTISIYSSQPNWKKFAHIEDEANFVSDNQFSKTDGEFLYDTCGAVYSLDGTKLISGPKRMVYYEIIRGTKIVGENAFKESLVENVVIPDTVTTIEDFAFEDCRELSSIVLPDSIRELGSSFRCCVRLKEVSLPRHINCIRIHTFRDCRALEKVYIPAGVEFIGFGAFNNCSSLSSIVIPEIASIESYAFAGCKSLTDVSLPIISNEEQIETGLFEGCQSLRSIYYPYDNIGQRMFARCDNLEKITVAGKIAFVDDSAFYCCSALRQVEFCLSAHPKMNTFENFYRFSGRKGHKIEFIIPVGSEYSFEKLYALAEKNKNIVITIKPED